MSARIAVYLSSHGFGHCVRTGALLERLLDSESLDLEVTSPLAPDHWPLSLRPYTRWHRRAFDAGADQSDDVTVDREGTALRVAEWAAGYEDAVQREAARLADGFDLVLGDVPPGAFEAAALARVPSVALANFSWDWIYGEMGFEDAAGLAARAYSHTDLLLELEPAAPMPAFPRRERVGLLGRRPSRDRHLLRSDLGVGLQQRVVLLSFRATATDMISLPEPTCDLLYLTPGPTDHWAERADVVGAPADWAYIDLVAVADAVVSKPGYGIIGDTAGCGTPLLFVERSGFPEDRILASWLLERSWAGRIERHDLRRGAWAPQLERLLAAERPAPLPVPAAEAGVAAIRRLLA